MKVLEPAITNLLGADEKNSKSPQRNRRRKEGQLRNIGRSLWSAEKLF